MSRSKSKSVPTGTGNAAPAHPPTPPARRTSGGGDDLAAPGLSAKRKYLTKKERALMLLAQHGRCAKCESKGPFIAEHWTPVALGNDQKPDCLLCVPCAKAKTNGPRGDLNTIAHVKRLRDGRTQFDKRKINGAKLRSGGKLQGRGFDKSRRRKMDGTVEVLTR